MALFCASAMKTLPAESTSRPIVHRNLALAPTPSMKPSTPVVEPASVCTMERFEPLLPLRSLSMASGGVCVSVMAETMTLNSNAVTPSGTEKPQVWGGLVALRPIAG